MIPAERQKLILRLIAQQQIVSISTLVEKLGVSHMTIRRDIKALEANGQVSSISGGVQMIERLTAEPTHEDKSHLAVEEKRKIAQKAFELIPETGSVFLEAGTTNFEIARLLKDREKLTVITNDMDIATYLMRDARCEVIFCGGRIIRNNHCTSGELTAQFIARMSVNIAFISASAWNHEGLTTPDENKIAVKLAVLRAAHQKYLVSDSTKYGKLGSFFITDITAFDAVITDDGLQKKAQSLIAQEGVRVILAS